MNLHDLLASLIPSMPEEIRSNPERLNDFTSGAEAMYKLLFATFGDDLR